MFRQISSRLFVATLKLGCLYLLCFSSLAAQIPRYRCFSIESEEGNWFQIYWDKIKKDNNSTSVWVKFDNEPPSLWTFNKNGAYKEGESQSKFQNIPPDTMAEWTASTLNLLPTYQLLSIPIFRVERTVRINGQIYQSEFKWRDEKNATWIEKTGNPNARLWWLTWYEENESLMHNITCYEYSIKQSKTKKLFTVITKYVKVPDRDLVTDIQIFRDQPFVPLGPKSKIHLETTMRDSH